jgi:alkylation response protein AidB-like acyl-CoA dehydrogenase
MRFGFTKEQDEFRASLRRALEARSPTKEVRRLMATDEGFDREAWRKLNRELGLTAIHIPEAYGGQGFGYGELGIVLEEMGRALVCAPFFSTAALASTAILNAGSEEQKKALLPGLADGSKTATLAFSEDGGSNDAAEVATEATPSGATWRLDGTKSFVLDSHSGEGSRTGTRPASSPAWSSTRWRRGCCARPKRLPNPSPGPCSRC